MDIDNFTQNFRQKGEKILFEIGKGISGAGTFDETEVKNFLNRIKDPQIQIAVIGEIKTGKSSLLNALFGSEIASAHVTPETACLSVFRDSEENYFEAAFYNEEEWAELWESVEKSGEDSKFSQKYAELKAEEHKSKYIGQPPKRKPLATLGN